MGKIRAVILVRRMPQHLKAQQIIKIIHGTIIKMVKQCKKFRKVYIVNLRIKVGFLI